MSKQIFISYRREGGEFLAKIIYDELTRNGYSVFFDIESMRSGRFNEQLYEEIKKSNDFLLILTPDCLDRCKNSDDWVRLEYEHAVKCGKNIIPILTRGFEFHEGNLPDSMKDLPMYERIEAKAEGMEYAMSKLAKMIQAESTIFPKADEEFKLKVTAKFLALFLAHIIFIYLYFFVIGPKFLSEEDLWYVASSFNMLFSCIGVLLLPERKKNELIYEVCLLYVMLITGFGVFCTFKV